jgi:hypothetical protein
MAARDTMASFGNSCERKHAQVYDGTELIKATRLRSKMKLISFQHFSYQLATCSILMNEVLSCLIALA